MVEREELPLTRAEHGQLILNDTLTCEIEYRIDHILPRYEGRLATSPWDSVQISQVSTARLLLADGVLSLPVTLHPALREDVWHFQSTMQL